MKSFLDQEHRFTGRICGRIAIGNALLRKHALVINERQKLRLILTTHTHTPFQINTFCRYRMSIIIYSFL